PDRVEQVGEVDLVEPDPEVFPGQQLHGFTWSIAGFWRWWSMPEPRVYSAPEPHGGSPMLGVGRSPGADDPARRGGSGGARCSLSRRGKGSRSSHAAFRRSTSSCSPRTAPGSTSPRMA